MALDLKLNEMMAFEAKAGMTWKKASPLLVRQDCQLHRLQFAACADCRKVPGLLCGDHRLAWARCTDGCEPANPPAQVVAAMGWLMRRRPEPAITWDAYINESDEADAWADVGNALAAAAPKQPSPPNTKRGSRPSSTGSPA